MSTQQGQPPSHTAAHISPAPNAEEAAAIVAAVEALWPKPVVMAASDEQPRTTAWRFSARWWAKPLPQRRDRPFR